LVGYFLFPVTIAVKVFAIAVLKCFNVLTNMEFEQLFVMSHLYVCVCVCMLVCMLVPCLLLNL